MAARVPEARRALRRGGGAAVRAQSARVHSAEKKDSFGGHVSGTCMRTPNSSAQLTLMRACTRPWRLKNVRSVPVVGCV